MPPSASSSSSLLLDSLNKTVGTGDGRRSRFALRARDLEWSYGGITTSGINLGDLRSAGDTEGVVRYTSGQTGFEFIRLCPDMGEPQVWH